MAAIQSFSQEMIGGIVVVRNNKINTYALAIFSVFWVLAGVSSVTQAEKNAFDEQLKEIQSYLKTKSISTEIKDDTIDLCKEYLYNMPRKLCADSMVIQRILSTKQLSMRKYGDIKAITEKALKSSSFERDENSVYTFDDGLYFYQCAEWISNNSRMSLHAIGINEHPSVGWFFRSILSTSSCDLPSAYKGIGF